MAVSKTGLAPTSTKTKSTKPAETTAPAPATKKKTTAGAQADGGARLTNRGTTTPSGRARSTDGAAHAVDGVGKLDKPTGKPTGSTTSTTVQDKPTVPAKPIPPERPTVVTTGTSTTGSDGVERTLPSSKVKINGEPHSAQFRTVDKFGDTHGVEGVTAASVQVTIDESAPDGLNFFALQVSFDNGTWAHGGLQRHTGDRFDANWGGLPPLPGDDDDYGDRTQQQLREGLELIQNGPNQNADDIPWEEGQAYVYSIERGDAPVTVPPGSYTLADGEDPVRVDHAREMYEWTFSVTPVGSDEPVYESTMLNSSATVRNVMVWNESGYGSMQHELATTWTDPQVTYEGDTEPTDVSFQQRVLPEPEQRPVDGPF